MIDLFRARPTSGTTGVVVPWSPRVSGAREGMQSGAHSSWRLNGKGFGHAPGQGVAASPSRISRTRGPSVSTATLLASQAAPRPTRPTEALDLRVALEDPAAGQAEKVANAFRPPISGLRRCPAVQVRHLSFFEDAVGAEENRA